MLCKIRVQFRPVGNTASFYPVLCPISPSWAERVSLSCSAGCGQIRLAGSLCAPLGRSALQRPKPQPAAARCPCIPAAGAEKSTPCWPPVTRCCDLGLPPSYPLAAFSGFLSQLTQPPASALPSRLHGEQPPPPAKLHPPVWLHPISRLPQDLAPSLPRLVPSVPPRLLQNFTAALNCWATKYSGPFLSPRLLSGVHRADPPPPPGSPSRLRKPTGPALSCGGRVAICPARPGHSVSELTVPAWPALTYAAPPGPGPSTPAHTLISCTPDPRLLTPARPHHVDI